MALSIKTPEADALARRLAAMTGTSLTDAVTSALRHEIARVDLAHGPDLGQRIARFSVDYREHVVDERGADEILGYDQNGLPR